VRLEDSPVSSDDLRSLFLTEQEILFGLFPDTIEGRFILVSKELSRMHLKAPDYRNGFKVLLKCQKYFSQDPFVNARMGRLCLEVSFLNFLGGKTPRKSAVF